MTPSTRFLRTISLLIQIIASVAALAVLGAFGLFLVAVKDLPRVPEPIGRINDTPATEIFSADGRRILSIGGRETVALEDVSYAFVQAILATEDHRFWEHHGLDKLRPVRVSIEGVLILLARLIQLTAGHLSQPVGTPLRRLNRFL